MSATLSEDTTEELADKGFVAIPEEEWENIRNQVQQNTQETSDLQEEIENQSQNVVGAFSKLSSIDDRVTELEEGNDSQDENPRVEPDSSGKTPLERIVNTPEHMVKQLGLSANQERSRNIARDVHEYAEKAPAGLVIDSSTIRKVHHRSGRFPSSYANCESSHGLLRTTREGWGRTHQETRPKNGRVLGRPGRSDESTSL